MSDFNMVNVDPQNNVGKSVDTTKLRMLELDERDFTEFLPVLKELQLTSSKILKDLNPGMVKREKKTLSLPYNLLRKFETLKNDLADTARILEFQGRVYGCSVANRDYEKVHEQQFFRKTLKSYDQKRQWMKQYILSNEATVQKVEEEVKKNVEYQTHQYTEFRRELNIERLELNYEPKIDLFRSNIDLLIQNNRLREKIKQKLGNVFIKQKKSNEIEDNQVQKIQLNKQTIFKCGDTYKMPKVPNFTPFLQLCLIKQSLFGETITQQLIDLRQLNKRITHDNQQFKLAIDKMHQRIEFANLQATIALQQLAQGNESAQINSLLKQYKITKTDYFIYLKQIQRHSQQILSIYGNYFQYAMQNQQFPNHRKSKSAQKFYLLPLSASKH